MPITKFQWNSYLFSITFNLVHILSSYSYWWNTPVNGQVQMPTSPRTENMIVYKRILNTMHSQWVETIIRERYKGLARIKLPHTENNQRQKTTTTVTASKFLLFTYDNSSWQYTAKSQQIIHFFVKITLPQGIKMSKYSTHRIRT